LGHKLPLRKAVDQKALSFNERPLAVKGDHHGRPLASLGRDDIMGVAQTVKATGTVPIIAGGINLHFVALVDAQPGVWRNLRNADKDSRIVVGSTQLVDDANVAISVC